MGSKLPNATIYLEATAPDWKSARFAARMLNYMGIRKVRGFMVNVTHFDWTSANIRYGRRISRMVGGKPFVVSTSYNGRGPVHYRARNGRRINVFCNVRYRGAGPRPTTRTGFAKVDAFLYLNRPGISGAGGCNGGPANGAWWPARALMYGRYATDLVGPRKRHAIRIRQADLAVPARRTASQRPVLYLGARAPLPLKHARTDFRGLGGFRAKAVNRCSGCAEGRGMRFLTSLAVSVLALLTVPALVSAQIAIPSGLPFRSRRSRIWSVTAGGRPPPPRPSRPTRRA